MNKQWTNSDAKLVSLGEHLVARENIVDLEKCILSAKMLQSFDGDDVMLTENFSWAKAPIGRAIMRYQKGEGLYAELKVKQGYDYKDKVPCIGFKCKKVKRRKDGVLIDYKGELDCVSFCKANADKGIKALKWVTMNNIRNHHLMGHENAEN